MYIFTIYDCVSEKAGNIFTTATIGEAERQFRDAISNAAEGSLFKSHPQDFSLELIGKFDPDTVTIIDTEKTTIVKGFTPEKQIPPLAEVSA